MKTPSTLAATFCWIGAITLLCASLFAAQGTTSEGTSQIKQTITGALKDSWKLTGFEAVDAPPGPWEWAFGKEYLGYAATCEDPTKTISDAGGKGGASNARRHPMFAIWLFRRPGVTPVKVQNDWQKLRNSPIQRSVPTLLGFNKDFVGACIYDCADAMVQNVAKALKLQSFSENGENSR